MPTQSRSAIALFLVIATLLLTACNEQESTVSASDQDNATPITSDEKSGPDSAIVADDEVITAEPMTLERPVVLSYYWPVVGEKPNPRELVMQTPDFIDILGSSAHGSPETRAYWTERGKVLLNRVYPFRNSDDRDVLRNDLDANLASGAGISIDELIFNSWDQNQQEMLAQELERARQNYPDKLIFSWDASTWNDKTAPILRRIAAISDAFAMQIYIPTNEGRTRGFGRFDRRIETALDYAPEIRQKLLIGIGAYKKMRSEDNEDLSAHLVSQVRYIACQPQFDELLGVAIYAPLYLKEAEQRALDQAIQTHLQPAPDERNCH